MCPDFGHGTVGDARAGCGYSMGILGCGCPAAPAPLACSLPGAFCFGPTLPLTSRKDTEMRSRGRATVGAPCKAGVAGGAGSASQRGSRERVLKSCRIEGRGLLIGRAESAEKVASPIRIGRNGEVLLWSTCAEVLGGGRIGGRRRGKGCATCNAGMHVLCVYVCCWGEQQQDVKVEIFIAGDGLNYPKPGHTVTVHYTGYVSERTVVVIVLLRIPRGFMSSLFALARSQLKDGTRFDSSRDRNKPFKFKLGAEQVIPGLDLGVAHVRQRSCACQALLFLRWLCCRSQTTEMLSIVCLGAQLSIGERAQLTIPAHLAYGERGFPGL